MFEHFIHNPQHGAVLACADDVGAALRGLRHLITMHGLFEKIRRVSGLTLKPKKCIAILTACAVTPHNLKVVRAWLRDNIPEWANFQISGCGKYLGVYIGPKIGGLNWQAPMDKFVLRTKEIANQKAPLVHACAQFASRALSVTGYVGQMIPPPALFKVLELRLAGKILRLATNSFCTNTAYSLARIHGPKLVRPLAYLVAALTRASFKTFSFSQMSKDLYECALQSKSLADVGNGAFRPYGWDSDALCDNLSRALKGDIAEAYFPGAKALMLRAFRDYQRGDIKGSLQKHLYNLLLKTVPNDFEKLFEKRFPVLGIDARCASLFGDARFPSFCAGLKLGLKHLPSVSAMALLRTWSNGWFTTSRVKNHDSPLLPCVFGCSDAQDTLKHYLTCDSVWPIVCSACGASTPVLSFPPEKRACLVDPSSADIARWVVVFNVYHSMRNINGAEIHAAVDSGVFDTVLQITFESSVHFAAESGFGLPNAVSEDARRVRVGLPAPPCASTGSSRVPVYGRRASSCTSGAPKARASPTIQSSGARSSFIAQVDAAMPAAWGHQQT